MKTVLRSVAPDDIRSGGSPDAARSEFHDRFDIPERRPPRFRVFVGLLAVLGVLSGMYALAASAETVEDLRGDIATGDTLRAELTGIAAERAVRLVALTSAEARLAEVLSDRDALGDDQRRLAAEIEAATVNLERLAVETFITGGDTGSLEYLAAVGDANDVAWRRTLIRSHAGSSKIAIDRLRALRGLADSSVVETIEPNSRAATRALPWGTSPHKKSTTPMMAVEMITAGMARTMMGIRFLSRRRESRLKAASKSRNGSTSPASCLCSPGATKAQNW